MWIKGELYPEVGRRGLVAVRVVWEIDELTSSALILDYDTDRNDEFSNREIETLRQAAFDHLIDSEYYLMVEVREMLATPGRAEDFTARITDGMIIYDFRIPLLIPIRWEDLPDVGIFLFDQSYFIDFRSENIRDTTVTWNDTSVEFRKAGRRSMTMGYGLVDLVGLEVRQLSGR